MKARPKARGAARTLSRGWSHDARKWTWATTAVLASTLVVLLGTVGILDGTTAKTLDQVSDFYTGQLRITPSRPGALPGDWFHLDGTAGAASQMQQAGVTVAARVETQYVLSRRGFVDAYVNEQNGVPVGVPGAGDSDPRKVVTLGAMVGILQDDAGRGALERHIVQGRLPKPSSDTAVLEVAMSAARMQSFLVPEERSSPDPLLAVGGTFFFDITAAQLDPNSATRTVLHRQAKVVGLYATGVDMLDSFTLLAPAQEVRQLMGRGRDEPVVNVLAVQGGSVAAAREVAGRNGWATQGTESFANAFVGQLIAVLQAVAWLVSALLFLLPTALIGHGLARQLSSQQRELAVATAIGVPTRTLADALSIQVFGMAGWAAAIAALTSLVAAMLLPLVLPHVPSPLPLGFVVSWRSVLVAAAVTAVSVAVGLWVGMRSRARLPLAASLRAA